MENRQHVTIDLMEANPGAVAVAQHRASGDERLIWFNDWFRKFYKKRRGTQGKYVAVSRIEDWALLRWAAADEIPVNPQTGEPALYKNPNALLDPKRFQDERERCKFRALWQFPAPESPETTPANRGRPLGGAGAQPIDHQWPTQGHIMTGRQWELAKRGLNKELADEINERGETPDEVVDTREVRPGDVRFIRRKMRDGVSSHRFLAFRGLDSGIEKTEVWRDMFGKVIHDAEVTSIEPCLPGEYQ